MDFIYITLKNEKTGLFLNPVLASDVELLKKDFKILVNEHKTFTKDFICHHNCYLLGKFNNSTGDFKNVKNKILFTLKELKNEK